MASLTTEMNFSTQINVMNDYKKVNFKENNLTIFITSTTSVGNPPDNAIDVICLVFNILIKFWKYLTELSTYNLNPFKGKQYALLGNTII